MMASTRLKMPQPASIQPRSTRPEPKAASRSVPEHPQADDGEKPGGGVEEASARMLASMPFRLVAGQRPYWRACCATERSGGERCRPRILRGPSPSKTRAVLPRLNVRVWRIVIQGGCPLRGVAGSSKPASSRSHMSPRSASTRRRPEAPGRAPRRRVRARGWCASRQAAARRRGS